ncbi:hypothetical protein LPB86_20725 [Pedobacter sp. MC2016-14]|uniref:hypothetical protein n=1 Tax=Pedobacter sp. MC2016-14 TaxID=2897327 RepID=UPI001E62185C|nr:hypothetical protein [Pedobacter sp. MC2016-14]MCD0490675.1 hypothetical protein [Pedobacter sp. MC2016-14]
MSSPKKSNSKNPLNDPSENDENKELSNDKIRNNYDDEEEDFDVPLDDLDTFDDFGSDDEDDY